MSEQTINSHYFHVEGVRCARCIHAIESNLKSEADVKDARVNMSTNRLMIAWEGAEERTKDFMQIVSQLGYPISPYQTNIEEAPEKKEDRYLLRCMGVAGFAMGNIMLISVALWSTGQEIMGMATRDLMHWISAIIALPTLAYAGQPFFRSALSILKKGHTNMDVPISLALILATAMSLFETINSGEHAYFDSAVMLLFFLLIGRWLDARARGKARENAQDLLAMLEGFATVIEEGRAKEVLISDLSEGMTLRVAVGEKIPTDCEVLSGNSEIDTSLVTGETMPIAVKAGDLIYGGTINLSSTLSCKVLKASEDSLLADIIRLMEQAEQGRARYVRLADKAARLYTPVVHSLAALAFLGWFFIGGMAWQDALLIAITTLIITCPCALGLAVPVVQVLASSWLMKKGILLKSGDALERLSSITSVIFDKTGTLTHGKPTLQGEYDPLKLQIAASLGAHSKHPYSEAVQKAYKGELLELTNIQEISGVGIEGKLQDQSYRLGKADNIQNQQDSIPRVWLSQDNKVIEEFSFNDPLREDSADVIKALRDENIKAYLLSGDRVETTKSVAEAAQIDHFQGGLMPQDKTEKIKSLQAAGEKVLMVGDGLNDAPSLAQADISISPSTGVDITQNTADIVFRSERLSSVLNAWNMAKFSTKLVKQNFALAAIYNCLAIPLAVMGYVTPLVAAIAMSLSSLIVIANSFRIHLMKAK